MAIDRSTAVLAADEFCTRTVSTLSRVTPAKVGVAVAIEAMNVSLPEPAAMVSPALRVVSVAVADIVPVMVSSAEDPLMLSMFAVSDLV